MALSNEFGALNKKKNIKIKEIKMLKLTHYVTKLGEIKKLIYK